MAGAYVAVGCVVVGNAWCGYGVCVRVCVCVGVGKRRVCGCGDCAWLRHIKYGWWCE